MGIHPGSTHVVERWRVRAILLRVSLFTTLVVFAALVALDNGLHSPHASQGMVSFELAGADASLILAEWTEEQRRDALLLQGLDYLFIPAYAALFGSAALTLAAGLGAHRPRLTRLAPVAVYAAALAGAADVVENIPLIVMLRAGVASPAGAAIAQLCAALKFGLLFLVLLYLVCARFARAVPER
jgi:hypothetical protein